MLFFANSWSKFVNMAKKKFLFSIQDTDLKLFKKYPTDPDDFLIDIGGRERLRDLIYDDEVATALDTRFSAVKTILWNIKTEDTRVYNFVFENISKVYDKLAYSAWEAVPFGYSVSQVIYQEPENGLINIAKVKDEPFEAFFINYDNEIVPRFLSFMRQDEVYPEKFFHTVRKQSSKYPMGEPLLAIVYFLWLFKRSGLDFQMEFLESYGKPFMHAMAENDDQKTQEIIDEIIQTKRPRGVGTGKDIEIKLIESTRSTDSFTQFQQMVSEKIQRAILGQTLTSGTDGIGSMALGEVHNRIRLERVVADCELIKGTIQNVVNMLCQLNGMEAPEFEYIYPKAMNKELVERDILLTSLGVEFTKDYIAENYDLDLAEFEIKKQEATNPFGFSKEDDDFYFGDNKKMHKCYQLSKDEEASIRVAERLEADALKKAGSMFSEDQVNAILKAKNYKDLIKRLQFYIAEDAPEYDDALTQLLFQRSLQGYVDGADKIPAKDKKE